MRTDKASPEAEHKYKDRKNRRESLRRKSERMKPLASNRQLLIWLCLHPADATVNTINKMAFSALCFALAVSICVASLVYTKQFWSIDLNSALYAFCQFVGFSGLVYVVIAAFVLQHEIAIIFIDLSEIYKACMKQIVGTNCYQNF